MGKFYGILFCQSEHFASYNSAHPNAQIYMPPVLVIGAICWSTKPNNLKTLQNLLTKDYKQTPKHPKSAPQGEKTQSPARLMTHRFPKQLLLENLKK